VLSRLLRCVILFLRIAINSDLSGFHQTVWENEAVAIDVAQQLRGVLCVLLQHYQNTQERLGSTQGDPLRREIQAFAW
jgi:hypothetical protein